VTLKKKMEISKASIYKLRGSGQGNAKRNQLPLGKRMAIV